MLNKASNFDHKYISFSPTQYFWKLRFITKKEIFNIPHSNVWLISPQSVQISANIAKKPTPNIDKPFYLTDKHK